MAQGGRSSVGHECDFLLHFMSPGLHFRAKTSQQSTFSQNGQTRKMVHSKINLHPK